MLTLLTVNQLYQKITSITVDQFILQKFNDKPSTLIYILEKKSFELKAYKCLKKASK